MHTRKKRITLILLFVALSIGGIRYWPSPPSYIPAKLWGVWKTDAAPYADRYLDISEAIFTIGQGQEGLEVLFLDRVEMAPMAAGERYALYYRPSGAASETVQRFDLDFFMTGATPRIQLNNPKGVVWYRVDEGAGDTQGRGAVAP